MNTHTGLFGILGIWLTMSLMPLATLLPHDAYQLMVLRGLPAALFLIFFLRSDTFLPDRHTFALSILFAIASLALFQAIKAWGANLFDELKKCHHTSASKYQLSKDRSAS